MSVSTESAGSSSATHAPGRGPSTHGVDPERQLARWGGIAGVVGAALLIASAVAVGVFGLPDASDVETLTDFADIKAGRNIEHFLYLGALLGFALHVFVLQRLLRPANPAASLFATVFAGFGLVIMAASSLLHVSTSPLSDLYTDPDTPAADLPAIEYAWHGAQSIFDTMLTTGVLLVPIGIILFGIAMRSSSSFGSRVTVTAFVLGVIGVIGATVAVIDPGSPASAGSVLAIVVFHLVAGWRTLKLADDSELDLTTGG